MAFGHHIRAAALFLFILLSFLTCLPFMLKVGSVPAPGFFLLTGSKSIVEKKRKKTIESRVIDRYPTVFTDELFKYGHNIDFIKVITEKPAIHYFSDHKMTNCAVDYLHDNFRNFGMVVYKSPAATFSIIKNHKTLLFQWQSGVSVLTEAEVRNEFMRAVSYVREHKLNRVIIDQRLYPYLEHFELQSWFEFEAMPAYSDSGIQQLALLVPPNKISELKEQRVESFNDPLISYLSEESEVMPWLEK